MFRFRHAQLAYLHDLAMAALKLRPRMKALFMSGHTEDVIMREGIHRGAAFLQKPFLPIGLAQMVREVLDSNPLAIGAE